MLRRAKFGMAVALTFLAIATAPAVRCLSFLAQNAEEPHSCCPHEKAPQPTAIPTCCIQNPAIVSHDVQVPTPIAVVVAMALPEPATAEGVPENAVIADVYDSPPDCSSVLRI